jgi:hypothetical protein
LICFVFKSEQNNSEITEMVFGKAKYFDRADKLRNSEQFTPNQPSRPVPLLDIYIHENTPHNYSISELYDQFHPTGEGMNRSK